MPLSAFKKAFDLKCPSKGDYGYLYNEPRNYGTTRVGLPEKYAEHLRKTLKFTPLRLYFNYDSLKKASKERFDAWYDNVPADYHYVADEEILRYCRQVGESLTHPRDTWLLQDVVLLMDGFLAYRQMHMDRCGFSPWDNSLTSASWSLFLMRYFARKINVIGLVSQVLLRRLHNAALST